MTPHDQAARGPGDPALSSWSASPPGPAARRTRVVGLDVARGLAILGMIVVNVGPVPATNLVHRLYLLPYGRASVLFVTLAGLGMGYLLRSRRPAGWSTLGWRALLLLTLGLLLQTLTDSVSVILQTYAVLFLLAPLLGRLSSRALILLTGTALVLGPALIVYHEIVHPWHEGLRGIALDTAPGDVVYALTLSGPYPLASWTVPFMVGLLLARLDLQDGATARGLLLWGGLAAVGGALVGAVSYAVLGAAADTGLLRLLTAVAHGQMPLWLVSSVGGAAFVLGACLRWQSGAAWARDLLADTGRFALTAYVLHVLFLAAARPTDGFAPLTGPVVAVGLSAAIVALARLQARTGRPGPLEWMLRHPWLLHRR